MSGEREFLSRQMSTLGKFIRKGLNLRELELAGFRNSAFSQSYLDISCNPLGDERRIGSVSEIELATIKGSDRSNKLEKSKPDQETSRECLRYLALCEYDRNLKELENSLEEWKIVANGFNRACFIFYFLLNLVLLIYIFIAFK